MDFELYLGNKFLFKKENLVIDSIKYILFLGGYISKLDDKPLLPEIREKDIFNIEERVVIYSNLLHITKGFNTEKYLKKTKIFQNHG